MRRKQGREGARANAWRGLGCGMSGVQKLMLGMKRCMKCAADESGIGMSSVDGLLSGLWREGAFICQAEAVLWSCEASMTVCIDAQSGAISDSAFRRVGIRGGKTP